MAKFLLITHWTGGDVFPFIRLGTILKRSGHKVTLFTHCYYKHVAEKEDLDFVAVDTPEIYEEMNKDLILLADPIRNTIGTLKFNKKYHGKERLLHEYDLISKHCDNKNTIIVARHRSSISGLLVAEKLKIPIASVFLAPNYLDHMLLHNQVFGKEIVQEINEARRVLGLEDIGDWRSWLYSPKRFFAFWPKWFAEGEEDWPKNIIYTGFIMGNKSTEEIISSEIVEFLEKYKQVVLITGGSSNMVKPEFYQVAAKSCEEANIPAILVTKYEEHVPDFLPESTKRLKNVPLSALMKKAVAIIHHGGMGTLSEAIEAGIPQIILPHLTDGPDNAQRLAHNGIAKVFPIARWDSTLISKNLYDALSSDFKERCLIFSKRLLEDKKDLSWVKAFEEMVNNEKFILNYYLESNEEVISYPKANEINKLSKQQLLSLIQRIQVDRKNKNT